MLIRVGFSADPDDAFMFWGLASGTVDPRGFEFEPVIEDIQTLNEWALEGRLEVTAMSLATYPLVHDRYVLLPHGASIGSGYGPIVVAQRALSLDELRETEIVVPGELTTAFLVLKLALGDEFAYRVLPFDEIQPEVAAGRARAGLLIHEGQLTYRDEGLEKCLDLGEWWLLETGLPLPLGVNTVRRDLGDDGAARGVGDPARVDRRGARAPRGGARVRARLRARHGRRARRPLRRHVRQRADAGLRRRGPRGGPRAAVARAPRRRSASSGCSEPRGRPRRQSARRSAATAARSRACGPDDLAGARDRARPSSAPAFRPEQIEDVWFGCANQAGEDNRNVARMARAARGPAASRSRA